MKGLQATQRKAVDQAQVVQNQLVAQKEESTRLSEQVATVTENLQACSSSLPIIRRPFRHRTSVMSGGASAPESRRRVEKSATALQDYARTPEIIPKARPRSPPGGLHVG